MIGHVVGPYRIVDRLGTGGMGEVYLADDPRLERKVALKCPSPEWLSQPDARERLQREARAAARLKHANIAAIYDVLDVDERPFIVMEYVEGKGLNECLRHERLSVEQAVQIAIQIADALAEAHANGVLHRDLKPGNIRLTTSGRVKVLDFGLAKMKPAQREAGERPSIEASLTAAGQMLGTPGYAAPEQLTGKSADQRSDIFAIGVILFEMLTGRLPFSGSDAMSLALSTVTEPAPSVRTLNLAVPPPLAAVVSRALEKDPKGRFPTAAAMAAELRRVAGSLADRPTTAIAESWAPANPPVAPPTVRMSRRLTAGVLAGILIVAGIVAGIQWATRQRAAGTSRPVIVVMPFEVEGEDPELTTLAVGLNDRLTAGLTQLSGVVVALRNAAISYAGPGGTAKAASQERATFLVQGKMRRAAAGFALEVSLTATDQRGLVWGRSYAGHLDDAPVIESRVRTDLATALRGPLEVPRELPASGTLDPQAFRYYSQGRELLDRRDIPGNIDRAIELFQSAVKRDPLDARSYAGLGEAYWQKYTQVRDKQFADLAKDALLKALSVPSQQFDPQVRYTLAVVHNGTGDADRAISELTEIIARSPGFDAAHRLLGQIYFERSAVDRAMGHFKAAIAIRPDYGVNHTALGTAALRAGRYDEARAAFQRVTELQPESPAGYLSLALLDQTQGDLGGAEANYNEAIRRGAGARADTWTNLAQVYEGTGRYKEALDAHGKALALAPRNPVYSRNIGDIHRKLGNRDAARRSYGEARRLAEDALKVNPQDVQMLGFLAVCEAKLGDAELARAHADQAVALRPRDNTVLYRRAAVAALAGDDATALEYLRRAINNGYSTRLASADDDLAALRGRADYRALVSVTTRK